MTPFIRQKVAKDAGKKSFKTLALLALGLHLTTAIPDALAVETFEEVQRMAQEGFCSSVPYSKKQLYDGITEKFLAFWNEKGRASYASFREAPSSSPLEANREEWETLEGRIPELLVSSKTVFPQWRARFFQEQKKKIAEEYNDKEVLRILERDESGDFGEYLLRTNYYTRYYFTTADAVEKTLLDDPAYAPLRELWEACKSSESISTQSTNTRVANTMRTLRGCKYPEIARIVLEDLTTDEMGDSSARALEAAQEALQKKHDQLVAKRRDFVSDIWGNGNFGVGKELLNMLRGVCDGLQPEALEEMPFVKYADFLPEAFVAQVMKPFVQEVLEPARELARTTL
jgi:hypothetical protein